MPRRRTRVKVKERRVSSDRTESELEREYEAEVSLPSNIEGKKAEDFEEAQSFYYQIDMQKLKPQVGTMVRVFADEFQSDDDDDDENVEQKNDKNSDYSPDEGDDVDFKTAKVTHISAKKQCQNFVTPLICVTFDVNEERTFTLYCLNKSYVYIFGYIHIYYYINLFVKRKNG